MRFRDRYEAGEILARHLGAYAGRSDVIVLGLPRGGVPVAFEVARALGVPLDVFVVRKLGVPGHEELAMGAIASGGVLVLNEEVVGRLGIGPEAIEAAAAREARELERRERIYRGHRDPPEVRGRTVLLVDDGLATGSTMRAAVAALRRMGPARLVVAVPTAAPSVREEFRREADDCIAVITPEPFQAVGLWYDDFSQTSDEEVSDLLSRARAGTIARDEPSSPEDSDDPPAVGGWDVSIPAAGVMLVGRLERPSAARGLVIFAHGSGSGRLSPRNRLVAEALRRAGWATLLIDLLDEAEAADRERVFDIGLLASRLLTASEWAALDRRARDLPIAYFGASTGAAAALVAAADSPERVFSVISRGGRPDLARTILDAVSAPTLLIVGGRDEVVLELNRRAFAVLRCPKELAIIPGATHLFPEPGALEEVARLSIDWLGRCLASTEVTGVSRTAP